MAKIIPFRPYRYSPKAGPLDKLVTQPYDKITPEMRSRYLAESPHNLVRIILGEPQPGDSASDNVYTRAAGYLDDWIATGILEQDAEASLFAYFQEFTVPDTGQRMIRKGFIGLGALVDYGEGVVHRHEQTLSGPKKDRSELLRHTMAHFGQIFMLYPDRGGAVDAVLDQVAAGQPTAVVRDEYAEHRLWKICDPGLIARIQELMADKKLLIADGHHRYETALAFSKANPELESAQRVMMTFVNMYSPGLKILATHRLVSNLKNFDAAAFLASSGGLFTVEKLASVEDLHGKWLDAGASVIGAATGSEIYALTAKNRGDGLDVRILHEQILSQVLGIGDEAVRNESYIRYMRGIDSAIAEAASGAAQVAFLLKPTSVEQVAEISFAGGVMPQKSTDFYPKLLTGLTIYKL